MLSIHFGDVPHEVYHPSNYFNNQYADEWITDEFSKEMILDVDKSTVIDSRIIDSPVLGPITPRELSGGVKTLILMAHDTEHIFNASACGDNCAKWILYLGDRQDFTIRLGYIMYFGEKEFTIEIANTGKIVHTMLELDDEVIEKDLLRD